jgi:hypothetical protein
LKRNLRLGKRRKGHRTASEQVILFDPAFAHSLCHDLTPSRTNLDELLFTLQEKAKEDDSFHL